MSAEDKRQVYDADATGVARGIPEGTDVVVRQRTDPPDLAVYRDDLRAQGWHVRRKKGERPRDICRTCWDKGIR